MTATVTEDFEMLAAKINKAAGRELVVSGSSIKTPERIPTGSFGLDVAIGGGWPTGRFSFLYGNKSSTKSTLLLKSVANAQAQGKSCLWLDTEKTFDPEWAARNGVDNESLGLVRSNDLEEILPVIKEYMSQKIGVIVVDSLNEIFSSAYLEEGSHAIGVKAKPVGEFLDKANNWNTDTAVLMIGQMRTAFGGTGMAMQTYAKVNNLEHKCSLMIKLFALGGKSGAIVENSEVIGNKISWLVDKSKISMPKREGTYNFLYNGEIDYLDEIVAEAIKCGVVRQAGAWFYFGDEKFQGANSVIEALADADIREKVINEVLKAHA